MGYVCRGECQSGSTFSASEAVMEEYKENQLPVDFYEIEDVLERRLCQKPSLTNTKFVLKIILQTKTCGYQLHFSTGR